MPQTPSGAAGLQAFLNDRMSAAIGHLSEGRPAEAAALLDEVRRAVPAFAPAHRLAGHARLDLGEPAAAAAAYRLALSLAPGDGSAEYGLGVALAATGELAEAERLIVPAVRADPSLWRGLAALGEACLGAGRHAAALRAYRAMLEATDRGRAVALGNIALCESALGRHEAALASYRAAAREDPRLHTVRENLVGLLYALGRADEAAEEAAAWLRDDPENPVAAHVHAAIGGGEAPSAASREYLRTLFDAQANGFDRALAAVGYAAPEQLAERVRRALRPEPASLRVLDAGCGTGLSGVGLRPLARSLEGVDLSEGMLRRATERGIYDRLEAGDALAAMRASPGGWDLVVAADVLIYAGEVAPWLEAMAAAVGPGGAVAFNVERGAGPEPWRLLPSGRYAHAEAPLSAALDAAGLDALVFDRTTLRTERGVPVEGLAVVAARRRPDGGGAAE
jgi:predicted TPR repeat methyltransferase